MKIVLSILTSCFLKRIVTRREIPVIITYEGFTIQKGVTPMRRSRIDPPPTAVTKPTTKAPNQSKFFAAARRIPEIAKAKVPI